MAACDTAFLILLTVFGEILNSSETEWTTCNFYIDANYTNAYCSDEPQLHGGLSSDLLCAYRCSETDVCKGFFYNTITSVCSIANSVPTVVSECQAQNGSVYYKKPEPIAILSTSEELLPESNFNGCDTPVALVTGNYGIPDSQITGTEHFFAWHPHLGRLDGGGQWVANEENQQQYIQFDFKSRKIVNEIITQGTYKSINKYGRRHNSYVKSYKIHYSTDCGTFTEYNQIFQGNNDQTSHVSNVIDPVIVARCVRVNPQTWNGLIGMRMELMGC